MTEKKKKKQQKCYIYIRVSTSMQVEGYSLEAQRERLNKFADYQGMEVVREYCDAGRSGKNITGRPEFTQMLRDIADDRDGVSYILVFKLSRFGRNAADVLNSLQYIQDYGVNLICVEDGIDSSKDSGKLTITVLSAVAEIERENILVQTMEGRKQKAREGKWNGGLAPFGYRLDKEKGELVVDPKEAEIVKVIFDKFINSDMGADSISNYLNDHGYTKNTSRDFEVSYFTRGHIMKILDNPVYVGKIVYGKSATEKVKGTRDQYRRVKQDDYLVADGRHDAIIDEDTWNKAREKRKETGVKWNKIHDLDHEHLLAGILKCPICGASLAGTVRRKKYPSGKVNSTFYYRCLHRKRIESTGKKCDFKPSLNQIDTDAEIIGVIHDMVNDEQFEAFIRGKLDEKVDVSSFEAERDGLRTQLIQATGAKDKLNQQLDRLDVTDRHYDRKYQDMQDRLDTLYDRIADLEEKIDDVTDKISGAYDENLTSKQLCKVLLQFDEMFEEMTDLERKEFLYTLIERIDLFPERQENGSILKRIRFKFRVDYDAEDGGKVLLNENDVETVCLLSNTQRPKKESYITLDVEMEDYYRIKNEGKNSTT